MTENKIEISATKVEVILPRPPNFLTVGGKKISIADLTEDQAFEIAQGLRDQFVEHHQKTG